MTRRQLVLATALLAVTAPAAALAAGPALHYDLATRQTDAEAGGEYDGRLRITIANDGIIAGTYTDTEGDISSVAGGLHGTNIWLDMRVASPGTAYMYTGTFENGVLHATHYHGLHTYTLEGAAAGH